MTISLKFLSDQLVFVDGQLGFDSTCCCEAVPCPGFCVGAGSGQVEVDFGAGGWTNPVPHAAECCPQVSGIFTLSINPQAICEWVLDDPDWCVQGIITPVPIGILIELTMSTPVSGQTKLLLTVTIYQISQPTWTTWASYESSLFDVTENCVPRDLSQVSSGFTGTSVCNGSLPATISVDRP